MTMTVWNVLRAMSGLETGRVCRRCGDGMCTDDHFGMSEGVCRACRG